MPRYLQVVDPSASNMLRVYTTQTSIWESNREVIESFLGCSGDDNLAFDVSNLGLKYVPESLKKQFKVKAQHGVYWAKENSAIKKQWVDLAQQLQLPCLTDVKLCLFLGIHVIPDRPKWLGLCQFEDMFVVIVNDHPAIKELTWATEITARHFAELEQSRMKQEVAPNDVVEVVQKKRKKSS